MPPIVLLLLVGGILGAVAPLAKVATGDGVPPAVFVFWMCFGAGLALLAVCLVRGQVPRRAHLRYNIISGLISLALPNLVLAIVVGHLGAGLTALMFTLPPLFTLGLAAVFRIEVLTTRRAIGVMFGLAGAVVLVLSRFGLEGQVDQALWMMVALIIPTSVAIGNIYRTARWPQGAQPLTLAAGLLLAAAVWAFPVAVAQGLFSHMGHWAVWVQAVLMALSYVLFFALQRAAGPVYLSQIGYVAAPAGLLAGVVLFGERPGLGAALGVALITLGVVLGNRRKRAMQGGA